MPKVIYHTHHIIPRHAGGTNDPSNLIKLTIQEHAEAHRLLWEQYGRLEDKLAWLGLSNITDEAWKVSQELATKAKQQPEVRAKMSQIKKQHWSKKEYKTKMLKIRSTASYKAKCRQSALRRDPSVKQKLSEISKTLWNDPKFKQKQKSGLDKPETRNIMRRKAVSKWSEPQFRAKMIEAQRRRRLREKGL